MKRLIIMLLLFSLFVTIARCAIEQHRQASAWWGTKPIERQYLR
jgi:hypothetical protein